MTESVTPVMMSQADWTDLKHSIDEQSDVLDDGAVVRTDEPDSDHIFFFATAINKPEGWKYGFREPITGSRRTGAMVGLAQRDVLSGLVELVVHIPVATQNLKADYESGIGDMDYVSYEIEADRVLSGTIYDHVWLGTEWRRLLLNCGFRLD